MHACLLSNAHVEGPIVEALLEAVHAGAAAHGGVDADHARIQLRLRDQRVRKEVGVAARLQARQVFSARFRKFADTACYTWFHMNRRWSVTGAVQ